MDIREQIAGRVALELHDGDVVNLGIGLPTKVVNYLPEGINISLQMECGMMGAGLSPEPEDTDPDIITAGAEPASVLPGGSFFDSAMSFAIMRGGHVDVTVLGAFQVDQQGNIASWVVPGRRLMGMGGSMDLVVGAKRVIVAMEHTTKDGQPRILKQCALPLTAQGQINLIVTERAVIEVTPAGLLLREILQGWTLEEVVQSTEAPLLYQNETLS